MTEKEIARIAEKERVFAIHCDDLSVGLIVSAVVIAPFVVVALKLFGLI